MIKNLYSIISAFVFFIPIANAAFMNGADSFYRIPAIDTVENELDAEVLDSLVRSINTLAARKNVADSIDLRQIEAHPFISVAQYVKGGPGGLYVQERSGEPGSLKNMTWRGLSTVLFSNRDLNNVQPTVFVNGVPLAQENNFAFDIQKYDFNKIGPETDLFTRVDLNAIKSIEIIKDPIRLAELGPLAANGAIWILTHSGRSGERQLSVNSYYGFSSKPSITPVNAEYENMFRQPFYAKYGGLEERNRYPGYLADSTNVNYYGPSNWEDLYYKNRPLYSVDMSLRGGSDRANFSFFGGHKSNTTSADNAGIKTYHALFSVNMIPFEWFTVSAFIDANRSERRRNTTLRDQFSETAYLPDLSTPLSPNKDVYRIYKDQHSESLDDNILNNVYGYLNFRFKIINNLSFDTKLSIDYTEGIRDVFWPSTLMEGSNFVSNYFGYTQRLMFSNNLNYFLNLGNKQSLKFRIGSEYLEDLYRFNYAKAYDGPNDFVKINVVEGNTSYGDYLQPKGGINVYRWNNKDHFRMQSFLGSASYSYDEILNAELLFRFDGMSTVQRDNRWNFSPAAHVSWNAKKNMFDDVDWLSSLKVDLGAARIGKPLSRAKYAIGPQYASNMGWGSETGLVSYNGFAGISRPYNSGWIGYGVDWAKSDQLNLSISSSFFAERLFADLSFYNKEDKNQIVQTPVPSEYGYVGQYKNGMDVRNKGVELTLGGNVFPAEKAISWKSSVSFAFNKNTLTSLPDNLDELIVGDRKLKIGKPIDQFWLYENNGIYENEADIPVVNGRRMSFDGVYLNAGDPRWVDHNGDNNIDDNDRVLKGQSTPKVYGGWNNQISFKNFDLNFQFYFAAGHKLLNSRASARYDFINNESSNTIQSVREIFHWQQDLDISKYPVYNPWSSVVPYRVEQDLFLENASFIKLRSVSLGYDLSKLESLGKSMKDFRRAYVYVSGTNLHTWTGFSGKDPELTEFNGYYTGYGLPLAPTFTLGIKLDL